MSKKTNQLDATTDLEAKNDSYLLPLADPINGLSKKMSVAQAKEAFGTKSYKYTATGSEGTTLTISAVQGYQILSVTRESGPLWEADAAPDSSEYTWDDNDLVLGTPAGPGERFLIVYRTY